MTKYVNFGLVMQVVIEACSKCKDTCDEFDGIYPDCNQCQLGEVRTKLSELPVLTVPPHGRLGDLDALKAKAIERSEKCGVCVNVLDKVITAYDIETAPTVIPASEECET